MRRILLLLIPIFILAYGCGGDDMPEQHKPTPPEQQPDDDGDKEGGDENGGSDDEHSEIREFFVGTTMSFASFLEDFGLEYRENGVVTDPYKSVKAHGANVVRLQLDREPFAEIDGVTIDWQQWDRVVADAKRAKAEGLDIILTLKPDYDKYSDTSASHNHLPADWQGLSEVELGGELYAWVYESLQGLFDEGIVPKVVAVGNEVNLGFLLDGGNDAARTARLLNYGHRAVLDFERDCEVELFSAVHIANPAKIGYIGDFAENGAVNYDIIAVSWYPGTNIGHSMGSFTTFEAMGDYLRKEYGKPLMILETAHSFTTGTVDGVWMGDWCDNSYNYPDWNDATNAANYTPQRQRAWLRALAEDVRAGGGVGVVTWGTESLPDKLEGKEQGHGLGIYTYPAKWGYGSTWENNSYWDFTRENNLHEGIDWMRDVTQK